MADDPAPGQGARNREGEAVLPDVPGLGVVPDPDWLGPPAGVHDRAAS